MKKIIILGIMSFLFVSCGTKDENEEFSTWETPTANTQDTETSAEKTDSTEEETKTTQEQPTQNDSWEKDTSPVTEEKEINKESSPQSDDQLVEDTIKDIESLFNDIEESVK
jgi:hypothetical protein